MIVMMVTKKIYKIGDILEINIKGVIIPCFIINLYEEHILSYGENILLGSLGGYFYISQVNGSVGMHWSNCCQLLIGDQKVLFLLDLIYQTR